MADRHIIEVLGSDFGVYPAIAGLNPMLDAEATVLKLTVQVDWHPGDAAERLREVEHRLTAAAPSLGRHQCRGPHQYRLFQPGQEGATGSLGGTAEDSPFEPGLALAHLLEHVIIDAVAYVTEAPRVSGLTGERGDVRLTFDVFVECPDRVVADAVLRLSRRWVEGVLGGEVLNGGMGRTLELARRLYQSRPAALDARAASLALGQTLPDTEAALLALVQAGFAREEVATLNLSGGRLFRCLAGGLAGSLADGPN